MFEYKYVCKNDQDVSNLQFIEMDKDGLSEYLKKDYDPLVYEPCAIATSGMHHYPGFTYFGSPSCLDKHTKYLVAQANNKIVGVIQYGDGFGYYPNMTCVCYIDVAYGARNKRVATRLIQELNKHIDKSKKFYIGQLSDMGQACHMDEVFKKNVTGVDFVKV